jgi:hypothetical protein
MAKLIFYPLGNADSTLIHLADDRLILKDYCNYEPEGEDDRRVRLDEELRSYLKDQDRQHFDVVAFSHADDDHIHGAENFFWFDHAKKYQGDDRIRILELFVPACFILETGIGGTARVIREEAKCRFRQGSGIRVFGNPGPLEEWLQNEGVDPAARRHLITKAGTCVPGFNSTSGQVEIFSHSPFSFRMEGDEVDRNGNCLVWHLTFFEHSREIRCILGADAECQAWADIVYITTKKGNDERLDWDLFRISHHCSYTALSDEKGEDETKPWPSIVSLFERGSEGCLLISSSDPIPDEDTTRPPHRQAAAYYRRIARECGNEDNFIVTMDWPPSSDRPRPVVVETTAHGFVPRKGLAAAGGTFTVVRKPSPRLG